MVPTELLTAFAALVLWTAGIVLTTVKYVRAFRAGKKLDAWIWFLCWCVMISFIEWVVFFGYIVVAGFYGQRPSLL
jgi:hypothetical protein